jgi:hypothetical protein
MISHVPFRRILLLIAALSIFCRAAAADDPPAEKPVDKLEAKSETKAAFELHHWGVWLADPALATINSREHFTTSLPLSVETTRPRRVKGAQTNAPINVVTFRGQPAAAVEIDLRLQSGSMLAHWPAAQTKNNRLRWLDYKLVAAAPEGASWNTAPPEHWFARARQDKGALVLGKGSRAEQFLTYDFEAGFPLPLTLEGGPDSYDVRSTANYPLHDVVLVAPAGGGRRIGWLDTLPAAHDKKPLAAGTPAGGNPADVATAAPAVAQVQVNGVVRQVVVAGGAGRVVFSTNSVAQPAVPATPLPTAAAGPAVQVAMSKPLAADSDEWQAQSKGKLSERLLQAGLAQAEVDLLISLYGPALFSSDSLLVAWRLPAGVVDELNPLTVEPEPTRSLRVVLVIGRNLDPQIGVDLQKFVTQLGSTSYQEREAAEQSLSDFGSLAFPVLRKALANSDPEIAFRAERLLLDQQQSIDLPAAK